MAQAVRRIFISATEVSADEHAAGLVAALRARHGNRYEFTAVGGERLRALGVPLLADLTQRSVVGTIEAVPHVWAAWRWQRRITAYLRRNRPDLVILVD